MLQYCYIDQILKQLDCFSKLHSCQSANIFFLNSLVAKQSTLGAIVGCLFHLLVTFGNQATVFGQHCIDNTFWSLYTHQTSPSQVWILEKLEIVD